MTRTRAYRGALVCCFLTTLAWPQQPETNSRHVTDTAPNVVIWNSSDGTGTNWGTIYGGFRMGIGFQKESFTNGEPIEGIVTLENVTNLYRNAVFDVAPFQEIVVLNDQGRQLQLKPELQPGSSFKARLSNIVTHATHLDIAPGGEAKLAVRLDTLYDLSAPGTYQVYFRLTLPREEREPGESKISSGRAMFRVLPQRKLPEAAH